MRSSWELTLDLRFRHGIQALATQLLFIRLSRGFNDLLSSPGLVEGFGSNRRDIFRGEKV